MSYCRAGKDSDLYVIANKDNDGYECMACQLVSDENDRFRSYHAGHASKMLEHLRNHLVQGHKIPHYTFDRLHDDAEHGF